MLKIEKIIAKIYLAFRFVQVTFVPEKLQPQ